MLVCKNIRKIRELRGYSEEYLALKLGMSQNNYSKIELGKIALTIDRMSEISKILEIEPSKLLEFDESIILNNNNLTSLNSTKIITDKLLESYERRIEGMVEEIKTLKTIIEKLM